MRELRKKVLNPKKFFEDFDHIHARLAEASSSKLKKLLMLNWMQICMLAIEARRFDKNWRAQAAAEGDSPPLKNHLNIKLLTNYVVF